MEQENPSRTALRVAMRRAMHQIADTLPLVVEDPYALPREALAEHERVFLDFLVARVAQTGEPFRLFLLPDEVRSELESIGWRVTKDLNGAAIHDAFFRGRSHGLALCGGAGHLVSACK